MTTSDYDAAMELIAEKSEEIVERWTEAAAWSSKCWFVVLEDGTVGKVQPGNSRLDESAFAAGEWVLLYSVDPQAIDPEAGDEDDLREWLLHEAVEDALFYPNEPEAENE